MVSFFIYKTLENKELVSALNNSFEKSTENSKIKGMDILKSNYQQLFQEICKTIFLEINEINLFKARLILSMIGQYIDEEFLKNYGTLKEGKVSIEKEKTLIFLINNSINK